jgi:hypothetical protein
VRTNDVDARWPLVRDPGRPPAPGLPIDHDSRDYSLLPIDNDSCAYSFLQLIR